MKNKLWVILLCIIMACASLTGCGKEKSTIDKTTIYKETALPIQFEDGLQLNRVECKNDIVYFTAYQYDEETWEAKQFCGSVNLDGTGYKCSSFEGTSNWIDNTTVLNNGNLLVSYSDYYEDNSDPDNYIWESLYYLATYTPDGKPIKKINLAEEEDITYVSTISVLKDGRIFVCGSDKIMIFDESLNCIAKKKDDSIYNYSTFYTLKDGRIVVSSWGENDIEYSYFDVDKLEKGEKIEFKISLTNYSVSQGSDKYDFFLRSNEGISAYNIGDDAVTPIMNFINSDIYTSYFSSLTQIDDTTFIGTYYDWTEDSGNNFKICKYTKVDPAEIKDKKELTLGVLYSDSDIRKKVVNYNKNSDEYRIIIKDYSMYDTEDDWDGGSKKLNTDIASGNTPDIVVGNGSLIQNYYSKGLFKDLNNYIKNDPDINYDDIFPNLIEACSYNGKLYEIVPSFYVQTVVAKTSMVGDRTSWTFDEYIQFKNSLPEGSKLYNYMTRDNFLYYIMSVDYSEFIDMAKAQCHFNSDEFIAVLNLLKDLPESDDEYWETYDYYSDEASYRDGTTALYNFSLSYLYDYRTARYGLFGEDISFIGYPCKDGAGSAISYGSSYAISSKCKHADVAWELIRTYLMEDYQQNVNYGIPAMMSQFDKNAEKAKEKSYYMDGDKKIEYDDTYYVGGVEIVLDTLTDSDIAKVKNFILSVNKTQNYMDEINTIILEEAEAFFEGQKSAEDVANIIQSRASIYINEKQ